MTNLNSPAVAAAAVAAIMADILSPGRVPRPRGFRVHPKNKCADLSSIDDVKIERRMALGRGLNGQEIEHC
jgi:hypothetical protein